MLPHLIAFTFTASAALASYSLASDARRFAAMLRELTAAARLVERF